MNKEIKYIVFDRDGTLIKHIPYIHDPKLVELLPNVKQTLKKIKNKNYKIFLHTNQSGISRGFFKISDAEKCNEKMISLIGIDKLFENICLSENIKYNNQNYRKPSPKFGLEILNKYKIHSKLLTYIGDSQCDLETANNLNCNFIGLNTGLVRFDKKNYKSNNFKYKTFENIKDILTVL